MKILKQVNDLKIQRNKIEKIQSFEEILEQHLWGLNNLPRDRSIDEFHPSEISKGFCPRQFCLKQKNKSLIKTEIDSDLRLIFDTGSALHYQFQNYLAFMGILWGYYHCKECRNFCKTVCLSTKPDRCLCNTKMKPKFKYEEIPLKDTEFKIAGKTDGILFPILGNKKYVFEFKTCNSNIFSFLKEPFKDHKVQANIYLWVLERMRQAYNNLSDNKKLNAKERDFHKINFSGIIIMYYNKDNSDYKIFILPYDEKIILNTITPILELIKISLESLEKNELPQRICKKPSKKCNFSEICFS